MFKRIGSWFQKGTDTVVPRPGDAVRLSGRAVRLPLDRIGFAGFEIDLGRQRLHLCPEPRVEAGILVPSGDFLLYDPQRFFGGISHSLRVVSGQSLEIDHNTPWQEFAFSEPREAFRRHLQIEHHGSELILRDSISELGSYLRLMAGNSVIERIHSQRSNALRSLRGIFGGTLGLTRPDEALALLQQVNELLRNDPYRERDAEGNPGGLLELPAHLTPIVLGDLHARVDNLLTALSQNSFLSALQEGNAALVILGDAVHREDTPSLERMDDSALIMDLILALKLRFPSRVFFVVGNHDSFSPEVMKGGVPQSLLWDRYLTEHRGPEYRAAMAAFYQLCPLVAMSPDFLACHAGPPSTKIHRGMLVEARQLPDVVHDLTWRRCKSPGRPSGYSKSDVNRFRKGLGLSDETPFFVGHFPLSSDATIWSDVAQARNHHIVFSAMPEEVGLFTRVGGRMVPQVYPVEPVSTWFEKTQAK